MSIFSPKNYDRVKEAINVEFNKTIKKVTALNFKPDEFYDATTPPEAKERAKLFLSLSEEFGQWINRPSRTSHVFNCALPDGSAVRGDIIIAEMMTYPLPRGMQVDVGELHPVYKELHSTVQQRVHVGHTYGKMSALLHYLNHNWDALQQLLFYFDGIMPILKNIDHEPLQKTLAKIDTNVMPKKMPAMPLEMRQLFKELNANLARYALIPQWETDPTVFVQLNKAGWHSNKALLPGVFPNLIYTPW